LRPNIEYLNKLKQERGWSNTQLAIKIGISRMEVSRLLRGVRVGGKKTIGGLINAFPDVPLDKLFFLDSVEPIDSEKKEKTVQATVTALAVNENPRGHQNGRQRLACPACGFGRLIDTGMWIRSEMHIMGRHNDWEADYYTKCPNPKCKAEIGIRKIE
jgi:transcriptional regulator with XRE-family HTH domain